MSDVNLILAFTSIESDFKHTTSLSFFEWFEYIELLGHDWISINILGFNTVEFNNCAFTFEFWNVEE